MYAGVKANTKIDAGTGSKIVNKAFVAPKYKAATQATIHDAPENAHAPAGTKKLSDTSDITYYRKPAAAVTPAAPVAPIGGYAPNGANRSTLQLGSLPRAGSSPTFHPTVIPALGTAPSSSVGGSPSFSPMTQPRRTFAPSRGVGTVGGSKWNGGVGGNAATSPGGGWSHQITPGPPSVGPRMAHDLGPVRSYKAGRGFGL